MWKQCTKFRICILGGTESKNLRLDSQETGTQRSTKTNTICRLRSWMPRFPVFFLCVWMKSWIEKLLFTSLYPTSEFCWISHRVWLEMLSLSAPHLRQFVCPKEFSSSFDQHQPKWSNIAVRVHCSPSSWCQFGSTLGTPIISADSSPGEFALHHLAKWLCTQNTASGCVNMIVSSENPSLWTNTEKCKQGCQFPFVVECNGKTQFCNSHRWFSPSTRLFASSKTRDAHNFGFVV